MIIYLADGGLADGNKLLISKSNSDLADNDDESKPYSLSPESASDVPNGI